MYRNTSECIRREGEEWLFGFGIFFPVEMTVMPASEYKTKVMDAVFSLSAPTNTALRQFMPALHRKQKQNVHKRLDIKLRKINLSGLFLEGSGLRCTLLSETAVQSLGMEHNVTSVFDTPINHTTQLYPNIAGPFMG